MTFFNLGCSRRLSSRLASVLATFVGIQGLSGPVGPPRAWGQEHIPASIAESLPTNLREHFSRWFKVKADETNPHVVLVSTTPGHEFLPSVFTYRVGFQGTETESTLAIMAMIEDDQGVLKPLHGTTLRIPTQQVTQQSIVDAIHLLTGYASKLTRMVRMQKALRDFAFPSEQKMWAIFPFLLFTAAGGLGLGTPHGPLKGSTIAWAAVFLSFAVFTLYSEFRELEAREAVMRRLSSSVEASLKGVSAQDLETVLGALSARSREVLQHRSEAIQDDTSLVCRLILSYLTLIGPLIAVGSAKPNGASNKMLVVAVPFIIAPLLAMIWSPNVLGDLKFPVKDPDELEAEVQSELESILGEMRKPRELRSWRGPHPK